MKKLWVFFKILLYIFIVAIIAIVALYTYAYLTPKIPIKSVNQFYIYDKDENLIHQGSSSSEWINLDNISPYLIDAVISTEDKNFYKHQGFDYLRIAKALFLNAKEGEIVQGASTISQQYIKNMYLDFDKTWSRKIEEAFLTLELEVHYSKDEILEGYLNTINFGQGNYGIENASKFYFNKSSKDLTLEEAVILAGIPKSPNNYNPVISMEKAIQRGKVVAEAMYKNQKITAEEKNNLFKDELIIYGKKDSNNLKTLMYYQDAVLEELKTLDNIPNSLIESGGLKIYTNLDMDAQTSLEKAIDDNMQDSSMQVASIIIDPKTGKILALAGGKDYSVSQYNRVTQAKRQVGSTMKPILYYAALENGMTSSSTFLSAPSSFVFDNNKTYSPANYNDRYANKEITMAAALAYSDNIYAVKTHLFLGDNVLVNTAKKMGIEGTLKDNPSLALGSSEINMLDFATAYTTLASGGYKKELYFISKVEDLNGNILYEKKEKTNLVLNPNYVYILNELLTSTYNSTLIDYATPTTTVVASKMTRKYAVKSGSTDTDYWTIGYNQDLLTLVWNGNDDATTVNVSDSKIAKNIWVDTMEDILKETESTWYEKPENVVGVLLNGITGEQNDKNNIIFYYLKGSEPTFTKKS